jgi:hypothetical protein
VREAPDDRPDRKRLKKAIARILVGVADGFYGDDEAADMILDLLIAEEPRA